MAVLSIHAQGLRLRKLAAIRVLGFYDDGTLVWWGIRGDHWLRTPRCVENAPTYLAGERGGNTKR